MKIKKTLSCLFIAASAFVSCGNNTPQTNAEQPTEQNMETITTQISELPSQQTTLIDKKKQKREAEHTGKVTILSEAEFIEYITEVDNPKGYQYKGEMPCVIDFYADWCRPCAMFTPTLQEVAKEYKGKILVYKVNVDKAKQIAQKLQIKSIPMFLLLKKNAQPASIVGAPSKEEFVKAIEEVLL